MILACVLCGCSGLRYADSGEDAGAAGEDAAEPSPAPPATSPDAGLPDASTDAGHRTFATYDDAQRFLESKRLPGPLTAQGSRGVCTTKHFVWRDPDGTLHAWAGATQARIDYAFKAPYRPFFAPSEGFFPVDSSDFAKLEVYATGAANVLVASLDYAYSFAGSKDGVIRLDQRSGSTDLGGTKVRRYYAADGRTEDVVAQILPTKQPPSSFANDEVVIPSDVNAPYALYIVNVANKSVASVTFDGGVAVRQTLSSSHGLFVSYARSGAKSALRLYRKNQDTPASRFELGDELANRPPVFPDSPAIEHVFLSHISVHGDLLFYDSALGIFAYDLVTTTLRPVQLGPDKTVSAVDTLCVIPDAGLLVYRLAGDVLGQIWTVPIASALE